MYAIATTMKDYSMAFQINGNLSTDLKNYDDIYFEMASDPEQGFSWYYFKDEKDHTHYYLIANKSQGSLLLPSQKTFDFILLLKDALNDEIATAIANKIRKTQGVTAVFQLPMNKIKDMDVLMETIELHELEFVGR